MQVLMFLLFFCGWSRMAFYSSFDVAERLSFLWSSLILLVFAFLVGTLRILFLPSLISCWTPAQFMNSHSMYALQACWNQNTSYLPYEPSVPHGGKQHQITTYHSFIPVIAVLLIIGFKIPEVIKVLLDLCTGSKPKSLVATTDSWEGRCASLAECGRDIVQINGIVKTLSFFLVKILILANLLIQFIFVRSYFRDSVSIFEDDDVTVEVQHVMFPKIIFCDFQIRQQSRIQSFTVQCQMPVNHLYREFFRIYSFWILGIGLFTAAIILFQIGTLMIPPIVGIRFRGIIPEKELKLRGFSIDDALLFLEEVKDEFGVSMARSVASKMWDSFKSVKEQPMQGSEQPILVSGDGFQEIPMTTTESGAADSSISPLLDNTNQEKTEIV
ncbi:hypothetical protein LOTGIDRAFT_168516 [Lottia gigantea]|uniref:Innexin n=1 Tax=Lottia gigantea TaxID=225164 RepID=V4B7P6_LOTGI|nr:hypothetical protein LOTGIDRAFT_168516 [Lottia gigantea]ESO84654.1 hypothetical protein LOTGIDRAFT_168516 [Lottia gigantea]